MRFSSVSVGVIALACALPSPHAALAQWEKLPPMPEACAGFACGSDAEGIVVIGGTNWKDGTKRWLQTINRFDPKAMQWQAIGQLAEPLSYAVCDVRRSDGVLIILGGSNGKAPAQAVVVVEKGAASLEPAPALPRQIVLSAGGIIGDDFIVAGGTDDAANIPGFTRQVFAWNLKSKAVTPLPDYPGQPFAMGAAAVLANELFVFGGAYPIRGITNTAQAFAFSDITKKWRTLKPCPIAARGAAAVAIDEHRIYLAGGYGGTPEGFLTAAFIYDARTDAYTEATPIPFAATAALIKRDGFVYCLGGEDNAKSRTDAMWRVRIEALDSKPATGGIPTFPGAQGWGVTTPGGRNGKVLFVSSLADSGPGTLREALLTRGPRTILFSVSGVIHLEKPIDISGPDFSYVTVAGQSAPGGGIALTGNDFILHNGIHDVVIRHVRFRACNEGPTVHSDCHHVVFDHCSFSWASDENLDIYVDTTDVTISRCIFAEGLINGDHPKGAGHGFGLLVGKGADRVSMHHNFFAGNIARNPSLFGGNLKKWRANHVMHPKFDFRNNLIYNARAGQLFIMGGPQVNVIGNVFTSGPDSLAHIAEIALPDVNDEEITTLGTQVFVQDNIGPHLKNDDQWSMVYDEPHLLWGPKPESYRVDKPIDAPMVTTSPSADLPPIILAEAGALPHDETDRRLMTEYRDRKGSAGAADRRRSTPFPGPEAGKPAPDRDQDGMPDAWEIQHKLNPDQADSWADPDKDGYGNLEEFLGDTNPQRWP